ncbi:MAG: hypothetical protein HKN45_09550 [Flavobacteriales bacterium]|nr:hypothetical protein [Flavobacteriales bacterium]NNK80874.1 hypothetical protein [Flavobacteriales bacterium]
MIRTSITLVALMVTSLTIGQTFAFKTFKDTRIVNGHSVETNNEGVGKFIISHRFGMLNSGIDEFFGLDQSTIRIGMDYGITDWWTVGLGRNSFEKTVDGFVKARVIRQSSGERNMPITLTAFSSMAVNTLPFSDSNRENYFTSRLTYTHQLLLARKFSDDLSIQLMPTLVHRNLVATLAETNDVFSCGAALRYQLTRNWALSGEYYYVLPDQLAEGRFNAVALGFELETRGHVFQFQFGNARGMIEKFFITETVGDILEGDIHFGFNITRDFKLKGRKYK